MFKQSKALPLSRTQQSLYYLANISKKANVAYNEALIYDLKGVLSAEKLQLALNFLLQKHEMLRFCLAKRKNGNIGQVDSKLSKIQLHEVTVDSLNNLQDTITAELSKPFDLFTAPLMRASLFAYGADCYKLVLVFHHIIIDGISLKIIAKELQVFYNQLSGGNGAIAIIPPADSYNDFVRASNPKMTKEIKGAAKELSGYNRLQLSPNKPIENIDDLYKGDRFYFKLDAGLCQKLKNLSSVNSVTMYQALFAIYALLLARYSGSDDIIIGAPFANRSTNNKLDVVGYYVSTLPVRIKLDQNSNFSDLLHLVRQKLFYNMGLQGLNFNEIINELGILYDSSQFHPLIQTIINWVPNSALSQPKLNGLKANIEHDYFTKTSIFDISLFAHEQNDGSANCYFEYSTAMFDEEWVRNFTSSFITLTNNIVNSVDGIAIKDLKILSKAQEQDIIKLVEGQHIYCAPTKEATLIDIFSATVKKHPQNIALSAIGAVYTYAELNSISTLWAKYLRSRYNLTYKTPMAVGTLIAICLDKSEDMIFAILAILKSGGAYVPIDPSLPQSRIAAILDDCQASIIITSSEHINKFEGKNDLLLTIADIAEVTEELDDITIASSDSAYIIYTSGSSGKPKGVIVSHGNVTNLYHSITAKINITDKDVWSMSHRFSFDVSVWEMWGAFFAGGKLVIVPNEVTQDAKLLYNLIRSEQVTCLSQTPLAFQMLIAHDQSSDKKLALRYIFFAGEKLNLSSLQPWIDKYGDSKPELINMYGTTETTIHSSYKKITAQDVAQNHNNVGVGLPGEFIYILDNSKNILPIGVKGEICLAGGGVTSGYLNRKTLTEEKFINVELDKTRAIYKTGDLGRMQEDGSIEYLGRMDYQVKLRGYRIELGDIEYAFSKIAGIEKVVVLLTDEAENAYLEAFYTTNADFSRSKENIYADLKNRLPSYMVPKKLHQIDELPLTMNGKIDRQRLAELAGDKVSSFPVMKFKNQTQQLIAKLWSEILSIDISQIGLHSNFFELGGNSLSVMKMLSQVQKLAKSDISVSQFIGMPTINSLAGEEPENGKLHQVILDSSKEFNNLLEQIKLIKPEPQQNLKITNNAKKKYLVTGTTGFLGAHILAQLLQDSNTERVYCLVRDKTHKSALARLFNKLKKYTLFTPNSYDKISIILGDLSEHNCGICNEDWQELAVEVDEIFHLGAIVNHLLDFTNLFKANVKSSFDLLRLASLNKNKAMHFVSTLAAGLLGALTNQDSGIKASFLNSGYVLSKYATEQLLNEASKRGVQCYIYRPGNIITSLKNASDPNQNNTLLRLKGMIELGVGFADQNSSLEMVPVDIVAQNIILLAKKKKLFAYNLHNPVSIGWLEYLKFMQKNKYPLAIIERASKWEDILANLDEKNSLYKFAWIYSLEDYAAPCLASHIEIFPPTYDKMLSLQLNSLQASRFLDVATA